MFNLTPEERKVTLFLLVLAFCGLILNNLIKVNCQVERIINPPVGLAKINLNKVNLQDLVKLKCIPVKLSQRILEYRTQRQEFSSLDELKEVKGIGEKRYEKLKEIFFVE